MTDLDASSPDPGRDVPDTPDGFDDVAGPRMRPMGGGLAEDDPAGRFSTRLHRLTGAVLLAWVGVEMAWLVVLDRSLSTYDSLVELAAGLGVRMAACAVFVALVFHALDGIRIVVLEVRGPSGDADRILRPLTLFTTAAVSVLGAAVILQPWVEANVL